MTEQLQRALVTIEQLRREAVILGGSLLCVGEDNHARDAEKLADLCRAAAADVQAAALGAEAVMMHLRTAAVCVAGAIDLLEPPAADPTADMLADAPAGLAVMGRAG